jgi:hypothetical protein
LPLNGTRIEKLKAGERLVKVESFIGHDLRRLVKTEIRLLYWSNTHQKQAFDGAPSVNIYAVDIANHWDV